jgi:hypoxia-inducible factor 1 alpha
MTFLLSILVPKLKNLDLPVGSGEEAVDDVKAQALSKYVEEENFALMALDGFLLALNDDGDITYVSENIGDILGLSKVINIQLELRRRFDRITNADKCHLQIDMMGQSIWDYAHACDHDELRETLNGRKTSPSEMISGAKSGDFNPLLHRDMMLRLKCTMTKSGRFVNIKSAAYKVKREIPANCGDM